MTDVPRPEHHHRDVQGGAARAAVFGVSDGLVSNVGLIIGVAAAADAAGSVVRVAGLAGLLAGAISMAAGEYNSMRVQSELLERELAIERRELKYNPNVEMVELSMLYQSRGIGPDTAREMAEAVMADPDLALQAHAREELGMNPDSLGSPLQAAVSSFLAFSAGALIPLAPWLRGGGGDGATVASIVLALATAVAVGVIIARYTERHRLRTVARQVLFTAVPAAITYTIGSALGVTV